MRLSGFLRNSIPGQTLTANYEIHILLEHVPHASGKHINRCTEKYRMERHVSNARAFTSMLANGERT